MEVEDKQCTLSYCKFITSRIKIIVTEGSMAKYKGEGRMRACISPLSPIRTTLQILFQAFNSTSYMYAKLSKHAFEHVTRIVISVWFPQITQPRN